MKTKTTIAFGKRVADLRKQMGATQEEFAFTCGINRTYIGEIERGEKNVSLECINRIANGLDIKLKDLFDYD